jgi:hypothetical protein
MPCKVRALLQFGYVVLLRSLLDPRHDRPVGRAFASLVAVVL